MITRLLPTLAQLVAGDVVENVERRLLWTAVASAFLLAGLVFILIAAYAGLSGAVGTINAALILAIACAAAGVLGFYMPTVVEEVEDAFEEDQTVAEQVDEKAHEAVDLLGPLQVATSAFMLGMTAGRKVRGR